MSHKKKPTDAHESRKGDAERTETRGDAAPVEPLADVIEPLTDAIEPAPDQPVETPEPDETPGTPADAENSAVLEAPHGGRKVTRKALLDRLFERSAQISLLTKKSKALEAQLEEAHDKWLRTAADFENYRKRTRKEWDLLRQQAKAEVVLEILNVVDDFERAFAAAEGEESKGFVEGFRLIYNNLTQTLEKIGVQELVALHTPFDPRYHMAVGQIEREGLDAGVVAEVVLKGYHLDGTVIRPATVLVAK